ncbi:MULTISPECIES: hypothetical protein [unclassified Coleofasciculus]|nr:MULTISPECIES: hypothetical protein [unclassified Coleofasciculus]
MPSFSFKDMKPFLVRVLEILGTLALAWLWVLLSATAAYGA